MFNRTVTNLGTFLGNNCYQSQFNHNGHKISGILSSFVYTVYRLLSLRCLPKQHTPSLLVTISCAFNTRNNQPEQACAWKPRRWSWDSGMLWLHQYRIFTFCSIVIELHFITVEFMLPFTTPAIKRDPRSPSNPPTYEQTPRTVYGPTEGDITYKYVNVAEFRQQKLNERREI